MLARLQRWTTLALLATAAIAFLWFWQRGEPGWAVIAALLVLFGHAFFLAFEFVLVGVLHRDDPAPRATLRQLAQAWLGEVVTAPRVFCWRQPFRSQAEPDHLPADAHGRRGVVLVHGFVCNRAFWNPWIARLRADDIACVAVDLEPVFGSIDGYPARIEAAVAQIESLTGLPPVIVAHSMGGLALRAWYVAQADAGRMHRIVTIGTPHRGTWLARWALSVNSNEMRRNGPWLESLGKRETADRFARFTCFYSHCDNIVFPASTATLPGADNRHTAGVAHVHMAFRPEVYAEVWRWLRG